MKSRGLVATGRLGAALMLAFVVALAATPGLAASGKVHFGRNVRVGGHDFSHQTFDSKHRAQIYLYNGKPRKEGCVWRSDRHGGRVKVCHLQRK